MSRSRAGSWSPTQPAAAPMVDGSAAVGAPASSGTSKKGTTTGPATPAGPTWMWAKMGGAILVQARAKQTRSRPVRTRARPRPSGSPGPGTSLAPVRRAASWCGRSRSRWRERWSWPRMAPAGKSAVWMLTYQLLGLAAIPAASAGSTSTQPATEERVSGREAALTPGWKSVTTTGPATPARPSWMWLAVGAPIPDHWSRKQALSPASRTTARPRPSGSPGPGTSLAPLRVAASRTTLPEPAPEAAAGVEMRASPNSRAAAIATAVTRFRIGLLLGSRGSRDKRGQGDNHRGTRPLPVLRSKNRGDEDRDPSGPRRPARPGGGPGGRLRAVLPRRAQRLEGPTARCRRGRAGRGRHGHLRPRPLWHQPGLSQQPHPHPVAQAAGRDVRGRGRGRGGRGDRPRRPRHRRR